VDGYRCGRIPPWTDSAGRGAGAEPTDIPRAFSSDLDHPGAWAFSIGRIQDFWIGLAMVAGSAGGVGRFWGRGGNRRDRNSDVSGIERYLRCGAEPVFC